MYIDWHTCNCVIYHTQHDLLYLNNVCTLVFSSLARFILFTRTFTHPSLTKMYLKCCGGPDQFALYQWVSSYQKSYAGRYPLVNNINKLYKIY